MNTLIAVLLVFIAGIINGSYALPIKHITKWKFENIWLPFALWTFMILPWLVIYILMPQVFSIYAATPTYVLAAILIGGLIFGVGQICFAFALHMIGFGLGFIINIGLGMSLGFLLPLVFQHPDHILTPFGIITLLGTLLALAGLIISNYAGHLRDKEKRILAVEEEHSRITYIVGTILAVVAGLSSAGQNFTFAFATPPMQNLALGMGATKLGAANIMWPGFLLCASIPYVLYMLYLLFKNKTFHLYKQKEAWHYYLWLIPMGLGWYGSLIFYSKASQLIGSLGPLVGWPLFMVLIILTSSFWGWRHKEWADTSKKVGHIIRIGLIFLISAVVVLAYSSHFHT